MMLVQLMQGRVHDVLKRDKVKFKEMNSEASPPPISITSESSCARILKFTHDPRTSAYIPEHHEILLCLAALLLDGLCALQKWIGY